MSVKIVSPYLEMPLRSLQQVVAERQRRAAKLAGTEPVPESSPATDGKQKRPATTSASTPPKSTAQARSSTAHNSRFAKLGLTPIIESQL
ncbi:MAG: hypothetical protein EXQ88_06990 [Alphaproteobacteria bacterium]|nr:hypothetical protein [Alphaproteobacteria bacterium]